MFQGDVTLSVSVTLGSVGFGRSVFLIEEVAPGAQPYLPSSAIYREAGWPL